MASAATKLVDDEVQGFAALTLSNGLISLTYLPELGGKISSLKDLRSGREWLWTNAALKYRKLPYGTSYVADADTGGWDECFPTVTACNYPRRPFTGTPLPDHGEIWPRRWQTEVVDGMNGLRGSVRGTALPYEFERTVTLLPGAPLVRLDYRVRSLTDEDLVFIWSAHPLFAIEPGMEVALPAGAEVNCFSSLPDGFLAKDARLDWPAQVEHSGRDLDLSVMPPHDTGVACKLWSNPLSDGWAALRAPDGELRFDFDPQLVPQVGIWLNAGAWSGAGGEPYYNLGLEPCIGAQDSLAEAVDVYGQHAVLPGRGERCWWLEVRLS